jgi:hypothetical protein
MVEAAQRFSDLRKVPRQPAARLLAMANARLQTRVAAPASAPVEVVLAELAEKGELVDMLRLLSVALPPRERVWWSCLAARDVIGEGAEPPPPLKAAEAWVFKPSEENRIAAQAAIRLADTDDDTVHCATGVLYCDGTLGPGELAQHQAPPGAGEVCAFAMNLIALGTRPADYDVFGQILVDRAVDIARGGSGRIEAASGSETA